MAYKMITAKGSRGTVKPGEVESLLIERADNGFTARIRVKLKPPRKGEMRDWDAGQELEVFNALDDLVARVKEAFSDEVEKKK